MEVRRSRFDIYLEILRLIHSGVNKPTRVMYGTNLSWIAFIKWTNAMIDLGLLVKKSTIPEDGFESRKRKRSKSCFELTDKGLSTIHYFKGFDPVTFELPPHVLNQGNLTG